MKYCEKCGQELKSRVCEFCGQESKPVTAAIQQSSNNSQNHKFRWFRSDRPKRYLAEMGLLATVALIALLVLIPSFQEGDLVAEVQPQQEPEQTEITEDISEPEIKKETENTEDPIEPEIKKETDVEDENDVGNESEGDETGISEEGNDSDAQESPNDDSIEESPAASVEEEAELEPDPPIQDAPLEIEGERDRFFKWQESIRLTQELPLVITAGDGGGCIEGNCVEESFCFIFDPPVIYSVGNLDGEVKVRFPSGGERIYTTMFWDTHWTHCYGSVNQTPGDLSNYDGNYRVEMTFPYYGSSFVVSTENRTFDLSGTF